MLPLVPFAPNYANNTAGIATNTVAEQIGNARNALFIGQRPTAPMQHPKVHFVVMDPVS
jgi:hypothetical protein